MKNIAIIFLSIFASVNAMDFGQKMSVFPSHAVRHAHAQLLIKQKELKKTESEEIDCHTKAHSGQNRARSNSISAGQGKYNSSFYEPAPTEVQNADQMIELSRKQWRDYQAALGKTTVLISSPKIVHVSTLPQKTSPRSPQSPYTSTAQLGGMNAGYTFYPFVHSLFNSAV